LSAAETPEDELRDLRVAAAEAKKRLDDARAADPDTYGLGRFAHTRLDGGVEFDGDRIVVMPATSRLCAGNCGGEVDRRGGYCATCAALAAFKRRACTLQAAYDSVSPDGSLDWCRANVATADGKTGPTPEYAAATSKALALARRLPDAGLRERAVSLVSAAMWKRKMRSVLLLGPTGIGKSKVVVAAALRVLDAALYGTVMDADALRFAARIRFASGTQLGRARQQSKLGAEPPIIARARSASLLVLDEIGFEESRGDPLAIRDVIYDRYDIGAPIIATSGLRAEQLEARYGEATMRRLWETGVVVDLHAATVASD